MNGLPAAVLWDMDGTLVDTEPAWHAAARSIAEEAGGALSDHHLLRLIGSSMMTAAEVLQETGVALAADDIVRSLTEQVRRELVAGLRFRPGAPELLVALATAGVPQAIVSMSNRPIVDLVSAAAPIVFATTVAGDEVRHGKPHPESYLLAAERLGVRPQRCVAIEDSLTGAAAAIASGATTIAAPLYAPFDTAAASAEWNTLVGRSIDDLCAVHDMRTSMEER